MTLLRNVPESFRDSPAPRSAAIMHGLYEVLASTDHLIRFGPVSTFATCAATEDNVKDHLFPESKTLK